jgi:hypothetical protein
MSFGEALDAETQLLRDADAADQRTNAGRFSRLLSAIEREERATLREAVRVLQDASVPSVTVVCQAGSDDRLTPPGAHGWVLLNEFVLTDTGAFYGSGLRDGRGPARPPEGRGDWKGNPSRAPQRWDDLGRAGVRAGEAVVVVKASSELREVARTGWSHWIGLEVRDVNGADELWLRHGYEQLESERLRDVVIKGCAELLNG